MILIRPAQAEDIPQVHSVYSHYVLHTPTDMHHEPPSLESALAEYETLTSSGLPYLVAVDDDGEDQPIESKDANLVPASPSTETSKHGHNGTPPILGFIHAFPFRGTKLGYFHTVELAIMCHPEATKRGVGGALMKAFLEALERGGRVEQVLAFMTVLEDPGEDTRVKGFYEKWGFREAGTLMHVGQKFGKRFSKRWMQREIVREEH